MIQSESTAMADPLLEICVDDVAGLSAAIAGGADRIELCSALSVGGLSPSLGFMKLAADAPIPVHALIRPRPGNFHHDQTEVDVMKRDIEAAQRVGLAGVVIGASKAEGRLDQAALRALIAEAEGMDLTLHRAFDLAPDLIEAMETAVDLGFRHILTSGGQKTAEQGLDMLQALASAAGERISILPGGGVRAPLAARFLSIPGIRELHASCSRLPLDADPRLSDFGFIRPDSRETDADAVRALKQAMRAAVTV